MLVVDNASTDDTASLLRSLVNKTSFPFRWITEPTPGLSPARNRAMAECRADYALFTDDDVQVEPDWIAAFCEAVSRHPDAACFGGPVLPWFPLAPDPVLEEAFPALKRGFCGTLTEKPEGVLPAGHHAVGANMGFSLARTVGVQFRTDLGVNGTDTVGGEEMAYQDELRGRGHSIVWVPSMRVRHYVAPERMTLSYLLKFARDAGRKEIRLRGVPPGTRLAGVPRWLLRRALAERGAALMKSLRGQRAAALHHERLYQEFMGMIDECRRRDPHASPGSGWG